MRYLRFFLALQSARWGRDLEHPRNFLITWLGSLCFFIFHLVAFSLILSKFSFPGWPPSHIWVLLCTFEIFTYLGFLLFWRGLIYTIRDIRFGTFDTLLTKPISTRLLAFFRNGGTHNLLSAILGVILLLYVVIRFHIPVTPVGWALYVLSLLLSLWTLHSLTVILISLNFFFGYLPFTQNLAFEIQEIYKYPATIFTGLSFIAKLFLIPLSGLVTVPAVVLLLKPADSSIFVYYLGSAVVLTLSSRFLWNSALRRYSSAS